MKSASAVSCSSCSYCDAISVKDTPYLVPCLGTGRLVFGMIALRESSQTRIRALCERLRKFAYPIALLTSKYHNRPNGSASEIRSTPRLSLRKAFHDTVSASDFQRVRRKWSTTISKAASTPNFCERGFPGVASTSLVGVGGFETGPGGKQSFFMPARV